MAINFVKNGQIKALSLVENKGNPQNGVHLIDFMLGIDPKTGSMVKISSEMTYPDPEVRQFSRKSIKNGIPMKSHLQIDHFFRGRAN